MGDQTDDPADPVLPERRAPDQLTRDVAHAKVAAALFADTHRVELGRYQLLERGGRGGMSVVWGAWDPQLERRVAIKVMQEGLARTRERMLAEGQALAKLSHPNVIPIYDVGSVDDKVYLVMEWVRGKTFRDHCREPRSVRELLALYRAAGEGLRAAHDSGLVHRDFKPDNVMVGDDGRVRVVDFGIALAGTRAGARAGTPGYMPEEQVQGDTVTPAADQYAFCTALSEALLGREGNGTSAAVPSWLGPVLARGTSRQAADRYPDMATLLAALARDPARIWRARAMLAAVVAIAIGAFAIGALRSSHHTSCAGSADQLAVTWSGGARAALITHLRELGPYGVLAAARLSTDLDHYGQSWSEAHHRACVAHQQGELTTQLYERELACFAEARAAFETVIESASRSPLERLSDAIVAEHDLPSLTHCEIANLGSSTQPPDAIAAQVRHAGTALARVRSLILAHDPDATRLASAVANVADGLGYQPIIARAQLELGAALAADHEDLVASVRAYERSTEAALASGDDITFVEGFARELFVIAQTDPKELPANIVNGPGSLPLAERLATRTGLNGAFARALLYNNAGTERLAAGDITRAREKFALAIRELEGGARGSELWASFGNLALATDDPGVRERLFRFEREHLERELGPEHVFTLEARLRAAAFITSSPEAARQLGDICTALDHWHPEATRLVQQCYYELAWLDAEADDAEGSTRMMAHALVGEAPTTELAALALVVRSNDRAATDRASVVAARRAADPAWWVRFTAVDAYLLVADSARRTSDVMRETAALRRALAILDDPAFNRAAAYYQRRLARVRALLARRLAPSEPETARALARDAATWYRSAGGYDRALQELASLTDSH